MKPVLSRCFTRVSALAVILLVGAVVSSAFGDSLPTPFYQYNINGLPELQGADIPGSFAGLGCDNLGNCQSSTGSAFYFNTNGTGTVSTGGTATHSSLQAIAGAEVTLIYYFGVFGPFNGQVPLRITGSLDTAALVSADDGLADAFATVKVNGLSTVTFSACENAEGPLPSPLGAKNGLCTDPSSLNFAANVLVNPNPDLSHLGSVILNAGCGADGGGCSASIDPMITFAPGFDSTGLTLEFSPGPAGATVPEPPSLLFLLSGIVLLVGLWRFRAAGSSRALRGRNQRLGGPLWQ